MNTATYNKDFHRTVKKAEIPTCNILGVDIAAIDMEWLLTYLNNNIKALAGDYICVSNVHTLLLRMKKRHTGKFKMVELWLSRMVVHFLQLDKSVDLKI